jgi:pimeloyl-ACP methyl ester carboxylesterase
MKIHNPESPRPATPCAEPENIFLFHGKGGSPAGSVLQLENLLRARFPRTRFVRPALLHGDPAVTAEASLERLRDLEIPNGSAVIGISLGGLVAAKLQESGRDDLHVTCISSPSWADGVALSQRMTRRLALYSSLDEVIEGRTANWPQLAQAYDLPWLTHDTDKHKEALSYIVAAALNHEDVVSGILEMERILRNQGVIA